MNTERWPFIYCEVNALKSDSEIIADGQPPLPSAIAAQTFAMRPALKLEMSYTPMQNYDAFDVRFTFLYNSRVIAEAQLNVCFLFNQILQ